MKLSIIIPAYNEGKRIGKTLESYGKYFKSLNISHQILIVINNTTDNTLEVVNKYKKKYPSIKHIEFKRGGKGFAVLQGLKHSLKKDFDFIGFVDADFSTPPQAFYDLVKASKGQDLIIANRYHKKSKIQTPLKRRIPSRVFNFATRVLFLFPFRDTQCGAKLLSRRAAKHTVKNLTHLEWAFDVDLIYRIWKSNFKVTDVHTTWKDAAGGSINLASTPIKMLLSIIRLRLVHSPFKGLVDLYNRLPERIKIHHNL